MALLNHREITSYLFQGTAAQVEAEHRQETTGEAQRTAERSPSEAEPDDLLSRLQNGGIVSPEEDRAFGRQPHHNMLVQGTSKRKSSVELIYTETQ